MAHKCVVVNSSVEIQLPLPQGPPDDDVDLTSPDLNPDVATHPNMRNRRGSDVDSSRMTLSGWLAFCRAEQVRSALHTVATLIISDG